MFNRLFFGAGPLRVLMAENDGAGDGGGGSGGGSGEGGGGGSVFTPEQQKALNAAISGHMQRLEKKIPTAESLTGSFSTLLEEKLKGFAAGGAGSGAGGQGGQGGSGGGSGQGGAGGAAVLPPEVQQQIAKQNSEIEKLRKEREEERKLREANEDKIRKNEERTELATALRNNGVMDAMIKPLVAHLHGERAIVKRNEEGGLVMTVKRDWGEEDVPLAQGIAEWAKTDEGKSYLPPKDVGGSGARGGNPPKLKAGEKPSRDQAMDMVGNWMMGRGGEG